MWFLAIIIKNIAYLAAMILPVLMMKSENEVL
jgi:hypothetical protein